MKHLACLTIDNRKLFIHSDGRIFVYHNAYKRFVQRIPVINNRGYYVISFNGKTLLLHRLLAIAFIQNPNNLPTVDHINRNKLDNRLCNLRWASIKDQANNKEKVINARKRLGYDSAKDYHKVLYERDSLAFERRKETNRLYREKQKSDGKTFLKRNGKHQWLPKTERLRVRQNHEGMYRTIRVIDNKRLNVWLPISEKQSKEEHLKQIAVARSLRSKQE